MTNYTPEALEALSKKATQGVWSVCEYDAGSHIYDAGGFPTPSIQCEEADCGIVHWDGFKQEYWVSANGNAKQIEANAAFIVTLVNAYRTGQLVHEQAPKDVVGWLYTRGEDDADILLDYRDSELRQAGYKEEALCRTKAEANRKFRLGDRVTKTKGSSWTGLVVGFYSTSLTPIGYAVESENEPGSVQIYPESALDAVRGKQ